MTATVSQALPAGFAYNLKDLMQVAQEKYGLSPREVQYTAQSLYERGLITYWKTDSRELAANMFGVTSRMVRDYKLVSGDRAHDPEYRSCGWVETLSECHHAITVTELSAAAVFGSVEWSEQDTQVYGLIRERVLAMFKRA